MIKIRIKYFANLCILLLSLSGQLVINTSYSSASCQHVKNQNFSKNVEVDAGQSSHSFISPPFVFNNKESSLFVYDEKFEDDKDSVISQKRNVENPYILSPFFNYGCTKLFFLKNLHALRFSKRFLHITYNKLFIVFQVFRI